MTRIGLIVDGQSEYYALPVLKSRISTDAEILDPLLADLQPRAPAGQIARAALPRARLLKAKRVDRIILLLDNESIYPCPGVHATSIERILTSLMVDGPTINVVKKVESLEHWICADPDALASMAKRFEISERFRTSVSPNKADGCSAYQLLKKAAKRRSYAKVKDASSVLGVADPMRMAANSRSFRRFLRLLGCPTYSTQSKHPTAS